MLKLPLADYYYYVVTTAGSSLDTCGVGPTFLIITMTPFELVSPPWTTEFQPCTLHVILDLTAQPLFILAHPHVWVGSWQRAGDGSSFFLQNA